MQQVASGKSVWKRGRVEQRPHRWQCISSLSLRKSSAFLSLGAKAQKKKHPKCIFGRTGCPRFRRSIEHIHLLKVDHRSESLRDPAVRHRTDLLLVTFSFVLVFAPLFRCCWGRPTQFHRIPRCVLSIFSFSLCFSN